jgi:tetratricopeptide (TPR) repeat protein
MPHVLNHPATGTPLPTQAGDVAAIRRAGARQEARTITPRAEDLSVAAIRRMWEDRTGEEPDAKIDARIRSAVENIADTNEGRFELIYSTLDPRIRPLRYGTASLRSLQFAPPSEDYESSSDRGVHLFDSANEHAEAGRHELAIQDYDEAIRLGVRGNLLGSAYFYKGWNHIRLRQYEQAIQAYDEAMRNGQDNWGYAYQNRGIAYERLGQYKLAAQDYDEGIRINDSDVSWAVKLPWFGIGEGHWTKERRDERNETLVRLRDEIQDKLGKEREVQISLSRKETGQWWDDFNSIVSQYESAAIPKIEAHSALKQLFQTSGFKEKDAEKQAFDAIDHITQTGRLGGGGDGTAVNIPMPQGDTPTPVSAAIMGDPNYRQTFIHSPLQAAWDKGFTDVDTAGGGFDRPRFAFERYLQGQDFGGRGIDVLAPSAQAQLRGEFPNRLSQFAIFGGGVPPSADIPPSWEMEPTTGEAGFAAFLESDVPTQEALANRLRYIQDLRRQDVAVMGGMEHRDEPGAQLSEGELATLQGYFFNPASDPATSEERLFRAGLQPALAGIRSNYLSEALEKGAAIGFERWRSHNPTKTFLDYAQETGLF